MERELGCNYKTAARIMRLIRRDLMVQGDEPLRGTVEVDESYFGGKEKSRTGKQGRIPVALSKKVAVLGMVERGGQVRVMPVANIKRATLLPRVVERVFPASTIYTDELHSYKVLTGLGFRHKRVHHREKVYVSGDVHTNTIEGFWSLTKNGIRGVYHAVSARHLLGYLNEYAWRYNHRADDRATFETLLLRAAGR